MMDIQAAVRSQYLSVLAMLQQAVERCPDELWDVAEDANKTWRVAYHALFFTHLYLSARLEDFRPWAKHWEKAEALGADAPAGPLFSKGDVLEYLAFCRARAAEATAALDPAAPSGFFWLPFEKLELQFYNIRHLQQHTGELMERLGARAGISCDWVSRVEETN